MYTWMKFCVYICRFTSSETGVLVASDVAARGLDLPQVQHVIHYQVPRNTEVYLHNVMHISHTCISLHMSTWTMYSALFQGGVLLTKVFIRHYKISLKLVNSYIAVIWSTTPLIQLYVHRSGRTARAQREGLSVMLVGPEDLKAYRNICKSLNKGSTLYAQEGLCL